MVRRLRPAALRMRIASIITAVDAVVGGARARCHESRWAPIITTSSALSLPGSSAITLTELRSVSTKRFLTSISSATGIFLSRKAQQAAVVLAGDDDLRQHRRVLRLPLAFTWAAPGRARRRCRRPGRHLDERQRAFDQERHALLAEVGGRGPRTTRPARAAEAAAARRIHRRLGQVGQRLFLQAPCRAGEEGRHLTRGDTSTILPFSLPFHFSTPRRAARRWLGRPAAGPSVPGVHAFGNASSGKDCGAVIAAAIARSPSHGRTVPGFQAQRSWALLSSRCFAQAAAARMFSELVRRGPCTSVR